MAERLVHQAEFGKRSGNHALLMTRKSFDGLVQSLRGISEIVDGLSLPVTKAALGRALQNMSSFYDVGHEKAIEFDASQRLGWLLTAVSTTLTDELGEAKFYRIQSSFEYLLDDDVCHFGDEVAEVFPSAIYDISESAKCIAFHRWTASVMHSMRVLEVGLNGLASYCDVEANENWNQTLNAVETKIRNFQRKKDGRELEQWAAEVGTHLRFVKNAWRNWSMHSYGKYTEDEAIRIFDNSKALMQHLTKRLSN